MTGEEDEVMEIPTLRAKRDRRAQPRIPPHETARTTPEDGDFVVREEKREGTLVYVLHIAHGVDQYLLRSRGEAIAQALAFAGRQHRRAWLTDEVHDFTLLQDFRVVATFEDVLRRLRAEFLEMPGLRLKPEQVRRLCGVERTICQLALDSLVDAKFLCVNSDGIYGRLSDGEVFRPGAAKADIIPAKRFVNAS